MNCLILGHYVMDEIHTLRGDVIESPGGIAFCLGGFNAAAGPDDHIRPVFPIGNDGWQSFHDFVEKLPAVDPLGCRKVDLPTTRVALYHDSENQYHTRLVRAMDSIRLDQFESLLPEMHLVYINMMTGDDITIDTAEEMREKSKAFVYLDIHMIAYRVGKDGERFLAPSDEWRRWLDVADAIQCNEKECIAYVPDSESVEESVAAVFRDTPLKLLVLTKGERGATVYTAAGEAIDIPPVQIETVVDPTGCGDVFGSFFARRYVETGGIEEAGALAARAASHVACMRGAHGIERLPLLLQGIVS